LGIHAKIFGFIYARIPAAEHPAVMCWTVEWCCVAHIAKVLDCSATHTHHDMVVIAHSSTVVSVSNHLIRVTANNSDSRHRDSWHYVTS